MNRALNLRTIATLAVCSAVAAANAAVELNLRQRVTLTSSVVRLADVANIATTDETLGRQLAELPLMPAPAPGTERFLRKQQVADLLAAHGVDLSGIRFGGAAQVAVEAVSDGWKRNQGASNEEPVRPLNRHAAVLAGQHPAMVQSQMEAVRAKELTDRMCAAVTDYLIEQTGQSGGWVIACEATERQLVLIASATSTLRCTGGNSPWTGRQRFVLSFDTPAGAAELPVYASVEPPAMPVVVAVRPIGRGEVFTAAHLEMQTVEARRAISGRRQAATSVEPLIGKEARQAIRAGDVLFSDQVQPRVLVKRGEVITVSSYGGGIRVRTTARARDDGAEGELVQVESLDTRERFDARVIGPRQAAVLALSKPAAQPEAERIETARR